jgi:hypothetical protein
MEFSREESVLLLNATPSLRRLELDFVMDERFMVWNDHISLRNTGIKTLSIHLNHFAGGKGLFGVHLDLPALHTLEFMSLNSGFASTYGGELIGYRLTPSKLVLPALVGHGVTLSSRLVHWLPSIEHLELTGHLSDSQLRLLDLRYYHQPSAAAMAGPKLKALHITDSSIDGETIIQFLQTRLQFTGEPHAGVSAIESIEMYNAPAVDQVAFGFMSVRSRRLESRLRSVMNLSRN